MENSPQRRAVSFSTETRFFEAILNGNTQEVERILHESDINVNDLCCHSGRRALHVSAAASNVTMCSFLLEKCNAHVNQMDENGDTPLHRACASSRTCSHESVCRLLLEYGAGLDILNHGNQLPIDMAKYDFLLKDVLKKEHQIRQLNPREIKKSERDQLKWLAHQWRTTGRCPMPFVDESRGITFAHYVAARGYRDVYRVLTLCPGVDLNCQDWQGRTPVQLYREKRRMHWYQRGIPSLHIACISQPMSQ